MDKASWQAVKEAGFAVPESHTLADLTTELFGYLGSTDPVLRDDIGYRVFIEWLIRKQVYSAGEMTAMIDPLLANLQQGLGEQGTDSVFLRSFSTLILAGIVYHDNHCNPFVDEATILRIFEATLAYFAGEQDVRGYVDGKGWAHSCAHTADLLDEFALNRYLNATHLAQILTALTEKVTDQAGYIYLHCEDNRMAQAVESVMGRDTIAREAVLAWLKDLGDLIYRLDRATWFLDAGSHSAYVNTVNFVRAVYVRLGNPELSELARSYAPEVLGTLHRLGEMSL